MPKNTNARKYQCQPTNTNTKIFQFPPRKKNTKANNYECQKIPMPNDTNAKIPIPKNINFKTYEYIIRDDGN